MKRLLMAAVTALGLFSSVPAVHAVPGTIDMPVDMSLSGGRFCLSSSCSNGWSFNQHQTLDHKKGRGIGGANDTYAWDVNLNSPSYDYDNGKPVRAVEAGTIYTGNGWEGASYGQILINHTTGSDRWSSGYLHMSRITKKSGTVKKGDIIGYISHVSPASIPNHLHFAVYNGHNAGSSSVNVNFSGRTAAQQTPAPTLRTPSNGATNVPSSNVTFSWNSSQNATNYRIVISQDSAFSGFYDNNGNSSCNGTCFTTATGSSTSYSKSMSLKNKKYYWKVRASGSNGTSPWSVTRSFTTAP